MSGADLRKAALENDSAGLKDAIVKMCNPCSCDEYGLSPLHYAVWNGHTECVKLLVCNARGVDARGIRCKSLELLSCMGYTALHLAALDCPAQSAYEVAALLLVGGSDHSAKSGDGRRAIHIAREVSNDGFIRAYEDFRRAGSDDALRTRFTEMRTALNRDYCLQVNTKLQGQVEPFRALFSLPPFLFDETRCNKPPELQIHEHQIKALTMQGYHEMEGKQSFLCLAFSMEQAKINKKRREKFIASVDPAHVSDDIPPLLEPR